MSLLKEGLLFHADELILINVIVESVTSMAGQVVWPSVGLELVPMT